MSVVQGIQGFSPADNFQNQLLETLQFPQAGHHLLLYSVVL